MPRRSTSLSNLAGSAITREIDSKYDVIKEVRENLVMLEELNSTDFNTLISELETAQDFTGITVVGGTVASWDAVTKTLTVPTVKGDTGATGAQGEAGEQGLKGDTGSRGPTGLKGDKGDIGPVGSKGATGDKGDTGIAGSDGADLTVEQIVYNGNGTFTWQFSDGTDYTTPDLRGEKGETGSKGDKGDTGVSVHHIKGTNTTDPEGDFSVSGEKDTYTMYGDADETINLGYFKVKNGDDAYTYATAGGYIGTYEEFTAVLTDFSNVKDKAQEAYTSATEAAGSAALASLKAAEAEDSADAAQAILTASRNMSVQTGLPGTYVEYDGVLNEVTIPRGLPGTAGLDGRTPQYAFVYNDTTGDIEYELTGYIDSTSAVDEEW